MIVAAVVQLYSEVSSYLWVLLVVYIQLGSHTERNSVNMSRINNDMAPALDYSQEARDLWGRLGEAVIR